MLVREADSTRSREGYGTKLHHEKYTGPWSITRVLMTGLSVEVELRGRKTRKRTVATSALKPFTVRPPDLGHTIEDEFAQHAWEADYSNPASHIARPPIPLLRTLVERRETTPPTGTRRWEYKGSFPSFYECTQQGNGGSGCVRRGVAVVGLPGVLCEFVLYRMT